MPLNVGKDTWGRTNKPADLLRYQIDVVNSSRITALPTMCDVSWPRITKFYNGFQWFPMIFMGSSKILFQWTWMMFLCISIVFIDLQVFFICCSMMISLDWFSMFFIDFQWCSYVLHRFPIPFKILWLPLCFLWFSMIFIGCSMVLLIFTMILNGFHWFLIIIICFSLFFQFTTSICYRRRSAGLFVLPHVSFPTFNDMRAWHCLLYTSDAADE